MMVIFKCPSCNSEIATEEGKFDIDCDCGITMAGSVVVHTLIEKDELKDFSQTHDIWSQMAKPKNAGLEP